ncbi:MAG TPA: lytic transglycosylase domain-containing protein, partial [bacterium (Candidatus Stahlbacteria)]|nr:lytic transglycosylase domain-containing protein [Candidatus Stahlbacteria bacterium]
KTLGGTFTNLATRAIVFNGIALNLVDGVPQTFTWRGLRIDSSAHINYFSHFGEVDNHKKDFLMLWRLEGSYAEATIFEENFGIDAISTVKGLALINQGVIQGVDYYKITQAEVDIIDTLNIAEATKVTMRDAVYQGNIIYTPSGDFTYQNWTGLVYINLDPVDGDGGYIIGENLNGGYTVGNFSEGMIHFFMSVHLISDLEATIVLPADGFTIEQGKTLSWSINYEGKVALLWPVFWNEAGTIDTTKLTPGSYPLKSKYGTDAYIVYVVTPPPRLGASPNKYDARIIAMGEKYEVPASILKSLIAQESGHNFNPNSYRYEPCIDYNNFSGESPQKGLGTHPFHHFSIKGKDARGNPINEGDWISKLSPPYLEVARNRTLYGLDITDSDGNRDLTLAELWKNNPKQNYEKFCTLSESEREFTVQFVVAASYGLGQILYTTALGIKDKNGNLIFDKSQEGEEPSNVYDLFNPNVSIELAVAYLRELYENYGQDWWTALAIYNGGPGGPSNPRAQEYATTVLNQSKKYELVEP